jgi:hypothetical protein
VDHAPGFSAACTSFLCRKFWEFWEFRIIRRHRSRVHQSRPEKERDLSHVTQPRARVNVSCSRAGLKGATGTPMRTTREDGEGWVPGLNYVWEISRNSVKFRRVLAAYQFLMLIFFSYIKLTYIRSYFRSVLRHFILLRVSRAIGRAAPAVILVAIYDHVELERGPAPTYPPIAFLARFLDFFVPRELCLFFMQSYGSSLCFEKIHNHCS